jgi:hypothetical protein
MTVFYRNYTVFQRKIKTESSPRSRLGAMGLADIKKAVASAVAAAATAG